MHVFNFVVVWVAAAAAEVGARPIWTGDGRGPAKNFTSAPSVGSSG